MLPDVYTSERGRDQLLHKHYSRLATSVGGEPTVMAGFFHNRPPG